MISSITSFFGKKREIKVITKQEQLSAAETSDNEPVEIVKTKKPANRKRAKLEQTPKYAGLGVGPAAKVPKVNPCGRFGAKGTNMNRVKQESDLNTID